MPRIDITLKIAALGLVALLVAGCDDGESSRGFQTPSIGASSSSSSGSNGSTSSSSSSSSTTSSSGGEKSDDYPITGQHPAASADNVSLVTTIDVTLADAVMPESVPADFITVSSPSGAVEGYLREVTDRRFVFTPYDSLSPNTRYEVRTAAIMSAEGLEHDGYQWDFTTVDNIGATPQKVIDECMDARDIEMLASVNRARSKARACGAATHSAAAPLKWNCQLRQAAQAHSDDMATFNFFSHTGNDGSDAGSRVSAANYRWSAVRENLAGGQRNIEEVMAGLLESEGHCKNIMANNVEEFGFGYAENADTTHRRYWTQVFASPW